MLDFEHLERLWPLGLAAGAVLLLGTLLGTRRRSWWAAGISMLLRGAALGIVIFLLLEPWQGEEISRPGTALAAVDLSLSVDETTRARVFSDLRRAVPSHLVGFGFGEEPIRLGADLPAKGHWRSDPLPALTALLVRPEARGHAGRLLLLTDGALPLPHELPALPGLEPRIVALGPSTSSGSRALGLDVPGTLQEGEPLRVGFRASSPRAGAERVSIWLDGARVESLDVKLDAGDSNVPLAIAAPEPGTHLVAVRFEDEGEARAGVGVATTVHVQKHPRVIVVSGSSKPLVASALKVQGLDVTLLEAARFLATPELALAGGVVILDRVSARDLSHPKVVSILRPWVERGGGLLYLPREDRGEMFDTEARPFLDLLPLTGLEPPPEPKPEEEEQPKEPNQGLKPPDPTKKKREKRVAPSLGLLLLVDASSSMKDQSRLRLAKLAALATAETLHPEDKLAIVAFNHEAFTVLELTKVGRMDYIKDRVARIQAAGGTDFKRALEEAREVFCGAELSVKHVILLSDGESRAAPLRQLLEDMVSDGITISTVGCGHGANQTLLSDVAAWGRGKFAPAFSAEEVPQVFTVEAERVIASTGARSRRDAEAQKDPHPQELDTPDPEARPPKPLEPKKPPEPPKAHPLRLGDPTAYTRGVAPHEFQGLLGFHRARASSLAWVSLRLESGEPVGAHGFLGHGRTMAFASPFEGAWAAHLVGWENYQNFLAQAVRFLHAPEPYRRFHVRAEAIGRAIVVFVVDAEGREIPKTGTLSVRDERGREVRAEVRQENHDRWRVRLSPDDPAVGLTLGFSAEGHAAQAFATVSAPPEIRDRGLSLPGLETWARQLGGNVALELPRDLHIPADVTGRRVPRGREWLPWLLGILLVDLLWKRLFYGRRRESLA